MKPYTYPHTIFNAGEELTFESMEVEDGEVKAIITNKVKPKQGPKFHVHFKQDEGITVIKGLLGYQIYGEEEKYIREGETVRFNRGEIHRFWNAGDEILECRGWVRPANSIEFYLTSVYEAMNKAGNPKGDPFDMAYLVTRYRKEYDFIIIPTFVKRIVMPVTVIIGKLLNKYHHFEDAPEPLK